MSDRGPDPWPSDEQWQKLAPEAVARRRLETDLYFREGWGEVDELLAGDPAVALARFALLCFKPEAVAARRVRPTLAHLARNGFRAIAGLPTRFSRHSMRELWRYDWTVYPNDRLAFSTRWYQSAETALFLFVDEQAERGTSASARMAALKGSAIASERDPSSLRTHLEPPNQVLNFVHVADTPGELVRELVILLEEQPRRAMIRLMAGGEVPAPMLPEPLIERLEAEQEEHDFDFSSAIARVKAALPGARLAIEDLERRRGQGAWARWAEICAAIPPDHASVDRWDFICIASHLIERERRWKNGGGPQ